MKATKATELRKQTAEQLRKELIERRKEQFNLRVQKATGQLARPDQLRKVRRDIARIKTVLNEQEQRA